MKIQKHSSCKSALITLLAILLVSQPAWPQVGQAASPFASKEPTTNLFEQAVPFQYQPLYIYLKTVLEGADATLDLMPKKEGRPIVFAAELLPANANRGVSLLDPATMLAASLYLDRLTELGVSGVKISINYPILSRGFPNSSQYLDFYKWTASEVKRRGMKLTIQSTVIFAGTGFSDLPVDYSGLSFDRFKIEYRRMAKTIINQLQPDYLVILGEPDTTANLTGLDEFNDPAKCVEFVNFVLNGLNRKGVKIGAGSGSWSPIAFTKRLAKETSLDFICIHVYPVTGLCLPNALRMAEIAKKHGKGAILNEAWLYKTAEPGGGDNVAASEEIFKRDSYGFWAPLDKEFFKVIVKLAAVADIEFVSFFWSNYLFAYLDYRPNMERLSYREVQQEANKAAFDSLMSGTFSDAGIYYAQLIRDYRADGKIE